MVLLLAVCAAAETYTRPTWLSSALQIPSCVEVIEAGAFADNSSIIDVSIPASVSKVCAGAFSGCENIGRVALLSRTVTLEDGCLGDVQEIWAPNKSTGAAYATANGIAFVRIPVDAADLLEYANTQLGTKYVHGQNDCIMFVRRCYQYVFGIIIPDTCWECERLTTYTSLDATRIDSIDELMPGDIICWKDDTVSYCNHVGMYISSGVFIESSSSYGYVRINNKLNTSYYTRNFICAWRIL